MESRHIFTYGCIYSSKLNKVKTQAKCWSATLPSVKLLLWSLTLVLALLSQTLPRKGSRVVRAGTSLHWQPGHGSPVLWEKGSRIPSAWTHTMQHQLASTGDLPLPVLFTSIDIACKKL